MEAEKIFSSTFDSTENSQGFSRLVIVLKGLNCRKTVGAVGKQLYTAITELSENATN